MKGLFLLIKVLDILSCSALSEAIRKKFIRILQSIRDDPKGVRELAVV